MGQGLHHRVSIREKESSSTLVGRTIDATSIRISTTAAGIVGIHAAIGASIETASPIFRPSSPSPPMDERLPPGERRVFALERV